MKKGFETLVMSSVLLGATPALADDTSISAVSFANRAEAACQVLETNNQAKFDQ